MTYNDLEESIKKRRSVYPISFSGNKVPNSTIEKMVELANWAPTHLKTEPWRFKVFSDSALVSFLDECKDQYVKNVSPQKFNSSKLQKLDNHKNLVSHILAIVVKRSDLVPEYEEIAATAMAVQNMWLYLSNTKKYGGYWSTPQYLINNDFRTYLNLGSDELFLGLFYVGELKENLVLASGKRDDWQKKVEFITTM
jgi:nitroreductase